MRSIVIPFMVAMGGAYLPPMALLCAVAPAMLGNMLELYEYNAYSSITSELSANLFSGSDYPIWVIFGVGQVFRPIGALVFGFLSDRVGRLQTIRICTIGMCVCTCGIGAIPTGLSCGPSWNGVGIAFLAIFRVGQGFFTAGALPSAFIFCMEHGEATHHGIMAALVVAFGQCGGLVASSVSALVESTLSQHDLLIWGWRLPFLIVVPFGILVCWLQRSMPEPEWSGPRESIEGILSSAGTHWPLLLAAFSMCSLQPVYQYGGLNYFKDFITSHGIASVQVAGWAFVIALIASILAIVGVGMVGDRLGHARAAIGMSTAVGLLLFPMWSLLTAPLSGTAHVYFASILIGALFCELIPFIVLSILLFPPKVRASLFGFSYNAAQAIFGSFAPLVNDGIVSALKSGSDSWLVYTTPCIFAFVGLLISVCGLGMRHVIQKNSDLKRNFSSPAQGCSPIAIAATLALLLDLTASTVVVPFLSTYDLSAVETSALFLLKPCTELLSNSLAIGPSAADYMGPRRPAMLGLVFVTVGTLMLASSNLSLLLISRALCGFGASLLVPSMFKLINLTFHSEPRARDRVVGVALTGDALGGVVGPILGSAGFNVARNLGASLPVSRLVPLLVIALVCLACLAIVFSCKDVRGEEEQIILLSAVLSRRGISAIAVAALSFGAAAFHIGALEATTPLLLIGFGLADVGYVWAFVGIGFSVANVFAVSFMRALHAPPYCCPHCLPGELDGTIPLAAVDSDSKRNSEQQSRSLCACIAFTSPDGAAHEKSALSRASYVPYPLRHAWASVMTGACLLLTYSLLILWMIAQLSPQDTTREASPPAAFLVEFCVAMLILGLALGMIYVPLNTFTQACASTLHDLTIWLLDQTALARTLGFLQGAKNLGLVLGYIVGPAMVPNDPCKGGITTCGEVSEGSIHTAARFQGLSTVLSAAAGLLVLVALLLRAQGNAALRNEASKLLPSARSTA
ncbi:hypothetical protein AB1Y20_005980 [Prymnesium parvum]|uniref:Major facilitator superfamily (MFS) profile domain-containing protein n=1 Tax=Prymnesium parvum TaxID=97485 RepID=A0AB34J1B9_PRYPA